MPDRTKQPRSNALPSAPHYVEGGQGQGDVLRTDLPQTTEIDSYWGAGLESIPLDSPANNQYAGPGAKPMYYRPIGKETIVGRAGLDDGDDQRGVDGHAMKAIAPALVGTSLAPRSYGRTKK